MKSAGATVQSEKGQRILAFLKKELSLPENVVGFDLSMRVDSAIMVSDLTYYPPDDEAKHE